MNQESATIDVSQAGGSGGKSERTESGRTVIQDARMEGRAIKWHGKQRYPVDLTRQELIEQVQARGDVTLPERLLLSVYTGLESEDKRRVGIAERNGIAIMGQVQSDDHEAHRQNSDDLPPVNINVGVAVQSDPAVKVILRNDFFKNRAHEFDTAESSEPSDAGTDVAGSIQDADLRSTLGENGVRHDGDVDGSRSNGNGPAVSPGGR